MPHSKTIYETLVVFYAAACQRTSLASYEQHLALKIWNPSLPESPLLTNCQFQLHAFMDTPDGIPNQVRFWVEVQKFILSASLEGKSTCNRSRPAFIRESVFEGVLNFIPSSEKCSWSRNQHKSYPIDCMWENELEPRFGTFLSSWFVVPAEITYLIWGFLGLTSSRWKR